VWATGYNGYGELGDGTTTARSTPVQVMDNVQSIVTGQSYSLFLKTDGTVWATGNNDQGQLGDGTTTARSTPVQVMDNVQSIVTGLEAVAGGGAYTLFLKTDGTVWATGYNGYGELGDGTTTARSTPVRIRP